MWQVRAAPMKANSSWIRSELLGPAGDLQRPSPFETRAILVNPFLYLAR